MRTPTLVVVVMQDLDLVAACVWSVWLMDVKIVNLALNLNLKNAETAY